MNYFRVVVLVSSACFPALQHAHCIVVYFCGLACSQLKFSYLYMVVCECVTVEVQMFSSQVSLPEGVALFDQLLLVWGVLLLLCVLCLCSVSASIFNMCVWQ